MTNPPGPAADLSARLVNTARERAKFSETTDAAAFTAAVPLADALGEIAALHHPRKPTWDGDRLCVCLNPHPCKITQIIDALEI